MAGAPEMHPWQDLHIYYIEGRLPDGACEAAPSCIGNWVEEGYSFLFFSRPARETVARILADQPGLTLLDSYRMPYEDWLGERFQAFSAGRFRIAPPWDPEAEDRSPDRILLDPGVVFGTGTHPTTRDCLELIERVCAEAPIPVALDVGTGTGLLALAAARAGCGRVLAFDLNLLAVRTTRRNILLNGLEDRVLAFQGNACELSDLAADLMIANIHYEVMVRLLGSGALENKRWVILSGLLRSQSAEVRRLLSQGPVEIVEHREYDGVWHTYLGRVRR